MIGFSARSAYLLLVPLREGTYSRRGAYSGQGIYFFFLETINRMFKLKL